jgi:preprotein translocase subunit SecE
MNRETRRMLQRQGAVAADGTPTRARREAPAARPARPADRDKRTGPVQFVREVRGELRKVVWPTRTEVINYSIIVVVALAILTAFVATQDWFWNWAVFNLYGE